MTNRASVSPESGTSVARAESDPGLVSASVITFGSSIAGLALNLARSKLLAVLLGPGGVAVLANIGTYNSLAVVVGNGLTGQGAIRSIAEARARGRCADVRWLTTYTLALPTLIGLFIFSITGLNASIISRLVTGTVDYSGLIVLSSVFIPVLVMGNAYGQVLQASLRVARIAAASVVGNAALLVATIALAIPFGLTGAILGIGAAAGVKIAYLVTRERWVLKVSADRRAGVGARPSLAPILQLSISSAILGIAGAGMSLLIRASIVTILGLDQNGIYQPVVDVSDTYLEVLLASTSLYLFPKMTALVTQGRRTEAAHDLGHGLRLLLVLTVPFALIGIGFGEIVIRALYSDSFASASQPLAIQMSGNILKVIAWSLGAALLPLGMYRAWLAIGLMTLGVRYVGVVVLAPSFGLDGVAIAYVFAWAWAALSTAIAVGVFGRLWPSRRDWMVTGVAAAMTTGSLAAATLSTMAGGVMSGIALVIWLLFARHDLRELISETGRRGASRRPS